MASEGRRVTRIGLVGCTKSKLPERSKAEELYSPSAMFRGRRAYVQHSCDRWFILSAEHGVLSPSDELEPYDVTLVGASLRVKREWSGRVLGELREAIGDLEGVTFEIHAGKDYWGYGLADSLRAAGATVEIPTKGMPQGMQLRFYRDHGRPS